MYNTVFFLRPSPGPARSPPDHGPLMLHPQGRLGPVSWHPGLPPAPRRLGSAPRIHLLQIALRTRSLLPRRSFRCPPTGDGGGRRPRIWSWGGQTGSASSTSTTTSLEPSLHRWLTNPCASLAPSRVAASAWSWSRLHPGGDDPAQPGARQSSKSGTQTSPLPDTFLPAPTRVTRMRYREGTSGTDRWR